MQCYCNANNDLISRRRLAFRSTSTSKPRTASRAIPSVSIDSLNYGILRRAYKWPQPPKRLRQLRLLLVCRGAVRISSIAGVFGFATTAASSAHGEFGRASTARVEECWQWQWHNKDSNNTIAIGGSSSTNTTAAARGGLLPLHRSQTTTT